MKQYNQDLCKKHGLPNHPATGKCPMCIALENGDKMPRCKDCTLGIEFECGIVGLCDHCGSHAEKEIHNPEDIICDHYEDDRMGCVGCEGRDQIPMNPDSCFNINPEAVTGKRKK